MLVSLKWERPSRGSIPPPPRPVPLSRSHPGLSERVPGGEGREWGSGLGPRPCQGSLNSQYLGMAQAACSILG